MLSNITHTWSLCTQASPARHQGLAIHAGRCIATTLGSPCDTSTTLSVVVTRHEPYFPSALFSATAILDPSNGMPANEATAVLTMLSLSSTSLAFCSRSCTTSMSSSALYIYASESSTWLWECEPYMYTCMTSYT